MRPSQQNLQVPAPFLKSAATFTTLPTSASYIKEQTSALKSPFLRAFPCRQSVSIGHEGDIHASVRTCALSCSPYGHATSGWCISERSGLVDLSVVRCPVSHVSLPRREVAAAQSGPHPALASHNQFVEGWGINLIWADTDTAMGGFG
jgi:hypothetical protein